MIIGSHALIMAIIKVGVSAIFAIELLGPAGFFFPRILISLSNSIQFCEQQII